MSAACGADAQNAHVRLLGQINLIKNHGILGVLFLEKLIPEIVSAHLHHGCLSTALV